MAIKTFTTGEVLTAADTNTYLANSGLVYITSGALSTATTDFLGCFTSTYDNYRIIITAPQVNSAADIYFRMLDGTTPKITNYYYGAVGYNTAGSLITNFAAGGAEIYTGWTCTTGGVGTDIGSIVCDIANPFVAKKTVFMGQSFSFSTAYKSATFSGTQSDSTAFSGLRISTLSTPTLTGTATIYGYRKP